MCTHVPNGKVAIRAACCSTWVDCWQCHDERQDHKFKISSVLVLLCKECQNVFKKDLATFSANDTECPFCGVGFVEVYNEENNTKT